jgi:hypothetical protein
MLFDRRRIFRLRQILAALVLTLAMSSTAACVATASSAPARGIVVNGPPPAPIAEVRSAPPSATASWVSGYWHWEGARYVWIPGHWENAPPGSQWYAPKYSQNADGRFFYEPGGWTPANQPVAAQPQSSPPNASAFH